MLWDHAQCRVVQASPHKVNFKPMTTQGTWRFISWTRILKPLPPFNLQCSSLPRVSSSASTSHPTPSLFQWRKGTIQHAQASPQVTVISGENKLYTVEEKYRTLSFLVAIHIGVLLGLFRPLWKLFCFFPPPKCFSWAPNLPLDSKSKTFLKVP